MSSGQLRAYPTTAEFRTTAVFRVSRSLTTSRSPSCGVLLLTPPHHGTLAISTINWPTHSSPFSQVNKPSAHPFNATLFQDSLSMVAARVTRSNISLLKLWTTDKGTFPIVIIAGAAACAAATVATRYLFFNPDVYFDKERREKHLHHDADLGSRWRQFRFSFANYDSNPINRSRHYEPMYSRPENQK